MADGFPTPPVGRPDIFSSEQQRLLSDNLDPKNVKTLRGNGYIEGWHAINEANRIFGYGAWDVELRRLEKTNADLVDIAEGRATKKQWRVGYIATVRVTVYGEGGSRFRDGTGFGSGYGKDNQLGEAIESASKEAETDAFKRACRNFGYQFGLALYDKSRAHVGESLLTDDDEPDAGSPDAGRREQPETQREAGAEDRPPASAPVQTMSKTQARPDNSDIMKEIAACKTVAALQKWGEANTARVQRQPKDWQKAIREAYKEKLESLKYMADSESDASRVFEEERR